MASKREQTYRIPGAQNEDGQSGTLVMTTRRGGQDTVEFEADEQGAQGEAPPVEQPQPEAPEQPGDPDQPRPGQLPAQPEADPTAPDLDAEPEPERY
jgi:hypothetical protein